MEVYTPPYDLSLISFDEWLHTCTIFLAGSIEMGSAEPYQQRAIDYIGSKNRDDITLFNPRRLDWDSSWVQSKDNPQFRQQVEWELVALDSVKHIIMYLSPGTVSPISLLELGLHVGFDNSIHVICPDGFSRKGNVDIVCERYGIPQYDTVEQAIDRILYNYDKQIDIN